MQDFVNEVAKQILPLFLIVFGVLIIAVIIKYFIKGPQTPKKKSTNIYKRKQFMTDQELSFYQKLKKLEVNGKLIIVPQINLATVIKKINGNAYQNELFRNIDFAIFKRDYTKLLLLIELNDSSHRQKKRYERDLKVRNICEIAGIPLITFYTNKTNDEKYMISRIINKIKDEYEAI